MNMVAVGVDHVTHSLASQYLGSRMVTTAKGFPVKQARFSKDL